MKYYIRTLKGIIDFEEESFSIISHVRDIPKDAVFVAHMIADDSCDHTYAENRLDTSDRKMKTYLHLNAYDYATVITAIYHLSDTNRGKFKRTIGRAFHGSTHGAERNACRCAFPHLLPVDGSTEYARDRAIAADPRWNALHAAARGRNEP